VDEFFRAGYNKNVRTASAVTNKEAVNDSDRLLRGQEVDRREGSAEIPGSSELDYEKNKGERDKSGRNQRPILSKDSEGREVTPASQKRLNGTSIIDDKGSPLAVYHGTGTKFDHFTISKDIGFHSNTMVKKVTIVQQWMIFSGQGIMKK